MLKEEIYLSIFVSNGIYEVLEAEFVPVSFCARHSTLQTKKKTPKPTCDIAYTVSLHTTTIIISYC